jgi:hypothetical protein
MKKLTANSNQWLFLLLLAFALAFACTTEEAEPDTEETIEEEETENSSALIIQEIIDHLKFENSTLKNGEIPSGARKADLKIDRETIFLAAGVSNLIKFRLPADFKDDICGVYLQVEDDNRYFELGVKVIDDSLFYFTIGLLPDLPESIENFKMKIVPYNCLGVPLDLFNKNVQLTNKNCSPSEPLKNWVWISTTIDDELAYAPGFTINKVTGKTNGCCMDGFSVDCISNGIPESKWTPLEYTSFVEYTQENLEFNEDGTFKGSLYDHKQNLDYSESNFCSNSAAYVVRKNENLAEGKYTFDASNGNIRLTEVNVRERQIELWAGYWATEWDFTFLRKEATYKMVSCDLMVERSSLEGMERVRLFERRAAETPEWVD